MEFPDKVHLRVTRATMEKSFPCNPARCAVAQALTDVLELDDEYVVDVSSEGEVAVHNASNKKIVRAYEPISNQKQRITRFILDFDDGRSPYPAPTRFTLERVRDE